MWVKIDKIDKQFVNKVCVNHVGNKKHDLLLNLNKLHKSVFSDVIKCYSGKKLVVLNYLKYTCDLLFIKTTYEEDLIMSHQQNRKTL